MTKKHTSIVMVVVVFVLGVTFSSSVMAGESTDSSTKSEVHEVPVDLGISDPGLLPTSKLYFLKEWSRGIQQFFTFNRVKKAELELDIANQKAAEIQKLKEISPENINAIERALSNYNETTDRLKSRLESLESSSTNPRIENLLEKIATQKLKHERLFENLKIRFEKHKLKEKIEAVEEKIGDALARIHPKNVDELITKAEEPSHQKEGRTWKVGIVSGGEFRPYQLRIKKGDVVVWVNLDKESHWPASSPHPMHTGYPQGGGCVGSAFDACGPIAPAASFKFVFNEVGNWAYHDHLHPRNGGTIIVEE